MCKLLILLKTVESKIAALRLNWNTDFGCITFARLAHEN